MKKEFTSIIQSNSEAMLADFFRQSTEQVLQFSLEEEVSDFLERDWYENSEDSKGYRTATTTEMSKIAKKT